MRLDNLFRIIPFSTFSVAGIIIAIRYDLWLAIVDEYSAYFNISQDRFLWFGILLAFGIMITGFTIWKIIEYILNYFQQRREAQQLYLREREALIRIFEALNGKQWLDKTRWCSDEPLYRWKGVKLDPRTHRVNKLILPDNNLSGHIPEEIGVLENLIEIDFRRNNIKGKIPAALKGLAKLEGLYLYENYLEGDIPFELADLPNLSGIYLFNNRFKNSSVAAEYFRSKLPEEKCYVFI